MTEVAEAPIEEVKNKTSAKSDEWAKKAGEGLMKLPGSAILTAFSEGFLHFGSNIISKIPKIRPLVTSAIEQAKQDPEIAGKLAQIPGDLLSKQLELTTNVLTAGTVATGIGGVLLGSFFGWQGVKHSSSMLQKMIYWGSRAGVIGSYLFAPAYLPVAGGIAAASTIIGMLQRK